MKKKTLLLTISGIACSILSSVAIYGLSGYNNIFKENNQENKYFSNYIKYSNTSKNNVDTLLNYSNIYNNLYNNLTKKVQLQTGINDISTLEERMLYNKIKLRCNDISNNQYKNGLYSILPITIENKKLTVEQIKKVIYAIQNDNPELFWISSQFSYSYPNNLNTTLHLYSFFSKEQKQIEEKKLNKKIEEIISKVPANANEYEKELFLHDYIIDNCKYKNIKGNQDIFTAHGCLVNNTAVCEGYSKAMQILLSYVGIDCRTVVGSRKSESHMWNIVKINGNWYHLDVTWDGGNNLQRHNYFNVTDEIIRKDHTISNISNKNELWPSNQRLNFSLPVCNCLKENYYEKNAILFSYLQQNETNFSNIIYNLALNNKQKYLHIKVDNNYSLNNAKNYVLSNRFFIALNRANKALPNNQQINSKSINYSTFAPQNIITIELNYSK